MTSNPPGPPPRPGRLEEFLAFRLFLALAPEPRGIRAPVPPRRLEPYELRTIPRDEKRQLAATFYPAPGGARGAVLLAHPWVHSGQAYFYRQGRIEALRAAGYHAMSFDLPGFGASSPSSGFLDREIAAALEDLQRVAGDLPLHLWGASSGGFWAHPVLSSRAGVCSAMFEDVSSHLLRWSHRMLPKRRPAYRLFRLALRRAYHFLDLRQHAPFLKLRRVAYMGGEEDSGVLESETRELARLADGRCLIAAEAGHLAAIKRAREQVIGLALETFEGSVSGHLHSRAPAPR